MALEIWFSPYSKSLFGLQVLKVSMGVGEPGEVSGQDVVMGGIIVY